MHRPLAAVLVVLAAALVPPAAAPAAVSETDLQRHLSAIFDIARANGGHRAAGTAGERATGEYAAARLAEAGWTIGRASVRFPYWAERLPSVLGRHRYGTDFIPLHYSGEGDVIARVRPVRRGGCRRRAYPRLRRARIVLVTAHPCGYRRAATLARRAGAKAVLVADRRSGPPPQATLAGPGVRVPVLSVRRPVARRLARRRSRIRVRVDAVAGPRVTQNVIAELPGGDPGRVVMAGAHIDSVRRGPGMNDDGSGVAALVEAGRHLASRPRSATLRLAFWSAHEPGVYGANGYVGALPVPERRRIAAYLNLDMVGSPNGVPAVYFDRPEIGEALQRHLAGAEALPAGPGGDYDPFLRAGIPFGGIFTGATGSGRGPGPADRCYHRRCDRLGNVDVKLLASTATAATNALEDLAR